MNKLLIVLSAGVLAVAATSVSAGDAAAGKAKYAACGGCHGANGVSAAPDTNPSIAGMSEADAKTAIMDYKSGKRDHAMMKAMTASLSDADIDNLAAHIATLKK